MFPITWLQKKGMHLTAQNDHKKTLKHCVFIWFFAKNERYISAVNFEKFSFSLILFSPRKYPVLSALKIATLDMNSKKLVIPLHFISWKKTPNNAVTLQHQSQFTPKMKANAVPHLLSSLVCE